MPNSKAKGNRFELEARKLFKAMGWESCETSRLMSKAMDDAGVDLVNTAPFNIQCKHVEGNVKTHEILLHMPDDSNYNLLFHKRNNKGVVVSMTLEDFKELLGMLIVNGIINQKDG